MTSQVHNNIPQWIDQNKKYFLPPVCNKLMHGSEGGQLKIMYIGGPNIRKDFHLEEGDELFYMVKGDMNLIVLEKGEFKDIQIKEGEIFLLPGFIPHSPQRYSDTVGLVIERERLKSESDCLRYFVDGTTETLFERWFYCEDLGVQLGPVIKEYFASEEHRTGKPIAGSINSNPPYQPDAKRELEEPFSLNYWIMENFAQINKEGKKSLFNDTYRSEIVCYGQGQDRLEEDVEHWLWQIEGESEVELKDKKLSLKRQESLLIARKSSFIYRRPKGSLSLVIKMNPKN